MRVKIWILLFLPPLLIIGCGESPTEPEALFEDPFDGKPKDGWIYNSDYWYVDKGAFHVVPPNDGYYHIAKYPIAAEDFIWGATVTWVFGNTNAPFGIGLISKSHKHYYYEIYRTPGFSFRKGYSTIYSGDGSIRGGTGEDLRLAIEVHKKRFTLYFQYEKKAEVSDSDWDGLAYIMLFSSGDAHVKFDDARLGEK